jgi:hypothetical protein
VVLIELEEIRVRLNLEHISNYVEEFWLAPNHLPLIAFFDPLHINRCPQPVVQSAMSLLYFEGRKPMAD